MPFNSLAFAVLLGSNRVLVGIQRLPSFWVLLFGSAIFYLSAGLFDLGLIFALILLNWLLQRLPFTAKWYLVSAIFLNVGALGVFKYQGLFDDIGIIGKSYADYVLPLGISFYTFQMIAYHIDVTTKRAQPAPTFKSFLLFVAFYPQLVAGPIVRANQLLPQINRALTGKFKPNKFITFGLILISWGLFKKVVLADSLSPIVDDIFFVNPDSFGQAWLGATLFAFQIYFDFSGYSDIAVGAAYLLGFRIPFNFRTPYLSLGPAEFWQRWHITLSTWIRDYLYIPLGGSRGSKVRVSIVLIVTMGIAGLWHGANSTFIVWGVAWGAYILVARVLKRFPLRIMSIRWLLHTLTVLTLWVFFRAENIDSATQYIKVMFDIRSGVGELSSAAWLVFAMAGLFFVHWLEAKAMSGVQPLKLRRFNNGPSIAILTGILLGMLIIPSESVNPFIYFRF